MVSYGAKCHLGTIQAVNLPNIWDCIFPNHLYFIRKGLLWLPFTNKHTPRVSWLSIESWPFGILRIVNEFTPLKRELDIVFKTVSYTVTGENILTKITRTDFLCLQAINCYFILYKYIITCKTELMDFRIVRQTVTNPSIIFAIVHFFKLPTKTKYNITSV